MFNKKTSNALSVLVTLWTTVLAFTIEWQYKESLLLDLNALLPRLGLIALTLLIPLLVIYANKRSKSQELSLSDQILQLLFFASWIALGLTFVFVENGTYLVALAVSLLLMLALLVKSFTKLQDGKTQKRIEAVNRTTLLLALNTLTIWVPLGYFIGTATYISAAYGSYPDGELMIIPILRLLAPMIIVGYLVALVTLLVLARTFIVRRLKPWAVVANIVWFLATLAYLALGTFNLVPTILSFHLV